MALGESVVEQSGEETLAVVSTHSTIWLSREEADGYRSDVGLLRPSDWLAANGVFAEGDRLELDLPEMGVSGEYQVMSIEPYADRSIGGGGLVTGCFRFSRGVICDLRVEGEHEVIGVTGLHPIWSEDRQDWVPAAELRVGERLQRVDGGSAVLLESRLRPHVEPVFNLEVDADHCYRVGNQGVVVHNASVNPNWVQVGSSSYTRYAQPAAKLRGKTKAQGLQEGQKTLAVLVYVDNMNVKHTLPESSQYSPFELSGGGHAEAKLLQDFAPIKKQGGSCYKIVEIFVERTPCGNKPGTANRAPSIGCETKIKNAAANQDVDIDVYFVAAAETTDPGTALKTGYSIIGLYNFRTGLWYGQE